MDAKKSAGEKGKKVVNTKAIRTKLMFERNKIRPDTDHDSYYDGCLDALLEVEKAQNPNDKD